MQSFHLITNKTTLVFIQIIHSSFTLTFVITMTAKIFCILQRMLA
ncbi:hypothetical protein BAZSYMA_ACONTIG04706_3 [Bathymodiolus azoricus thioautotrophic gill symbiont]|uniref:Uncharacterized protein n=1 Tax=Bathymodiolus azoricus thioautotrophic gill symbiont TaxID=235205 RepID=A0A1H6KWP2_9GAMM|nr:hypothetical protein BAZSYMA_ACONTIG04706_3 [Bathymodiolus azoricus thioautotrophic gill symbiont]